MGRFQINWHDTDGKFLKADINTFDCSVDWSEHIMTVTAPPMATHALVYTSGPTTESLSSMLNFLLWEYVRLPFKLNLPNLK